MEDALAALDRGETGLLSALLATGLGEHDWLRAWHAVSTLAGEVVGRVVVVQDDARFDGILADRPPLAVGGAPRAVEDPGALGRALAAALEPPPTLERHRRAALATLSALADGSLPCWASDPAAALLRHHTDLPVDMPPRPPLADPPAEAALLAPLLEPLRDPSAFRAHLVAGADSPSRARRHLARRLLALDPYD